MAAVVGFNSALGQATSSGDRRLSAPIADLTVYGQTLWNLEALLHDTFGRKTTCLRLRDTAFVSSSCGDLADYGYWKDVFRTAHHSHFRLVRRAHPPSLGKVSPVIIKGRYVFCGRFPVAFPPLANVGSQTRRWLVVLHGWAMTPFTCLGQ